MKKWFKESKRVYVLTHIITYIKQTKGVAVLLAVANLLAIPVSFISPRFFQILIDDVLTARKFNMFWIVAVGMLSVWIARMLLDTVSLACGNRLLNRFTLSLRHDVWHRLTSLPFRRYEQMDVGDIKMRLMDDVDSLGSFVKEQAVDYASAILTAVFAVVMTVSIDWRMTLICICILPLVFLINYGIGRGTKKVNEDIRQTTEKYYSFTHASLQFWREIKAQGAEQTFIVRFKMFRTELARLGMRWIRYWFFGEVFGDFKANYLTKVFVYIVGAFFVINGSMSVGVLMMYAEYFSMLFNALDAVNSKNVALHTGMPYYSRIFAFLHEPIEDETTKTTTTLIGKIDADALTFRYHHDTPLVLDGVELHVPKGDYLAIVGRSGCGKTTLAKLMTGLYRPDSGCVTLDGLEISAIASASLHEQVAIVSQDSYLFNMSIRDNLLMAKEDADDDILMAACQRADIGAFISSLPEGLDTVIGERGIRLSGGQKQRLAIAQALLKQPKLMIFDEATSSLDRLSEEQILSTIRAIAETATVIVISHKPATVLRANRVAVMEDGRIADIGTHEELLARNNFYQQIAVNA